MLRITLRDGEKAIVNGAVIRAVGRTQIAVENKVSILRGREIMRRDSHHDTVVGLVGALIGAFSTQEAKSACIRFASEIAQGEYYKALTTAREVIAFEDAVVAQQAA